MSYIMVDIEADGPIPGDYSMVAIGAVVVEPSLQKRFYGKMRPISNTYVHESLKVTGFSRERTLNFEPPEKVLTEFDEWIHENSKGHPIFISDNNGFDFMFVCWYFHHFLGYNPFGHSSMNLGSIYKGIVKNEKENFKHLRKTPHSHNPVDDALGNAEALLHLKEQAELNFTLE